MTGEKCGLTRPRSANAGGFSLHANVAVGATDRRALVRLCRYTGRGPLATELLTRRTDSRLADRLKRPCSNNYTIQCMGLHSCAGFGPSMCWNAPNVAAPSGFSPPPNRGKRLAKSWTVSASPPARPPSQGPRPTTMENWHGRKSTPSTESFLTQDDFIRDHLGRRGVPELR